MIIVLLAAIYLLSIYLLLTFVPRLMKFLANQKRGIVNNN
jgi:hypothetical protein